MLQLSDIYGKVFSKTYKSTEGLLKEIKLKKES